MRKRERENPCGVCGHYHKYEEGEVCGVCGHRLPAPAFGKSTSQLAGGAFPSEILKGFLYLGSYDNACRGELLKTLGISHILNTVSSCQNLYKNSFAYYCLHDDKSLQFDDAVQFIVQCEKDAARVLVHCMSGRSRSPAIVIAYLMKSKGWRLAPSLQWVKERRPVVSLSTASYEQLMDYEKQIFGSSEFDRICGTFPVDTLSATIFGSHKTGDIASPPTSNQATSAPSNPIHPNSSTSEFVFRAGMMNEQRVVGSSTFGVSTAPGPEAPMDSC